VPSETLKKQQSDIAKPAQAEQLAAEFISPQADPEQRHLKTAALKAYGRQTKKAQRDKMVVEFLPMVHKIVHQVTSYLRPPLSREDLVSAGTIGLVKAARDFDPSKNTEFKTYAYIRIRGAVIDELRGWSFTPVNIKKEFDRAQKLQTQMTEEMGQMPSDEQLAERFGTTVAKMYKLFETARARHFLSIHGIDEDTPALGDSLAAAGQNHPGAELEQRELVEKLAGAIQHLPSKERKVVTLYYHKELTMKDIAAVLKVTESRVSQLHASALFKLSSKLRRFNIHRCK